MNEPKNHCVRHHAQLKPSATTREPQLAVNKFKSRVSEVVEEFLHDLDRAGCPSDTLLEHHSILVQFEINVDNRVMSRVTEYQLRYTIYLRNCRPESQQRIQPLLRHLFAWAKVRGYLPPDEPTAAERLDRLEQTCSNEQIMRRSWRFCH